MCPKPYRQLKGSPASMYTQHRPPSALPPTPGANENQAWDSIFATGGAGGQPSPVQSAQGEESQASPAPSLGLLRTRHPGSCHRPHSRTNEAPAGEEAPALPHLPAGRGVRIGSLAIGLQTLPHTRLPSPSAPDCSRHSNS